MESYEQSDMGNPRSYEWAYTSNEEATNPKTNCLYNANSYCDRCHLQPYDQSYRGESASNAHACSTDSDYEANFISNSWSYRIRNCVTIMESYHKSYLLYSRTNDSSNFTHTSSTSNTPNSTYNATSDSKAY